MNNNEEQKINYCRAHEILTCETLTTHKGKNHTRQPAIFHYTEWCLQILWVYNDAMNPSGGLQGEYIDVDDDPW
jgi:hypothetical protein